MIVKSITAETYADKEVFPLPNGKRGDLLEYGKQNLGKLKSAGKIDPKLKEASDMNKEVASLITANAFPEVRKEDDSYSPNFIDVIRSIATDEFGNQYQRPLIKTSPKKMTHFKGPTLGELLDMFEENYQRGGTASYEQFKYDLVNGNYEKLHITPDEFLKPMFGGEPVSRKEAARRMEDAPYEEQDFKGAFMKLIKDRTGMGISGLYEEEMNDRKNGL